MTYQRDMIGYGNNPPNANWPNGAKLALQIIVAFEEGSENSILHGDAQSENFISDIIGAPALLGVSNMNMESLYEYGSRVGYWPTAWRWSTIPRPARSCTVLVTRSPATAGNGSTTNGWVRTPNVST